MYGKSNVPETLFAYLHRLFSLGIVYGTAQSAFHLHGLLEWDPMKRPALFCNRVHRQRDCRLPVPSQGTPMRLNPFTTLLILPSLFSGNLLVPFAKAADAQSPPEIRVLPEPLPNGAKPSTMVLEALQEQATTHFDRWQQEYEARTDLDQIGQHQAMLKREFTQRIGGLPRPTALNAKITGQIQRDGYRVEKVLLESQPNFFVTSALFLPDAEKYPPPWPAVIVLCGHSAEGKLQDGYQRGTALAALNGLAAMIVDPIGQGERLQVLDDKGNPRKLGSTTEHTLLGTGAILVGWNTARWMIGDAMSAIDYLQSRNDILADRIGCMGNSGGGTQTSYVMALDERVEAAAPSCYITSFRKLLESIGPQDAEQNIFGQIALGMDHADYLMMRAPKPTLICSGTHDYFDIHGAWSSYRAAKRLFHRYGLGRNVELVEVDDKHGWHPPQRVASVQFMVQHLAGRVESVYDPEVKPLTAAEMNVTPDGSVMRLPNAISAFDHVRQEAERLATVRAQAASKLKAEAATAALQNNVRAVTGIRTLDALPEPEVEKLAAVEVDGLQYVPLIIRTDESIWLPALLVEGQQANAAEQAGASKVTCLMLAEGKQSAVGTTGEIQRRVAAGQTVLAIDARGVGETVPVGRRWYSARFGANGGNSTIAYLLGKSLVALRAEDCLAVCRWLTQTMAVDSVALVASGELTIPGLHAAALHPELIDRLETRRGLDNWSTVTATALSENQVPGLVHGALRQYDLSDLAASLGDRLQVVQPHDATDQPISD